MFGGDADPDYFETEFPKYPTQALKALIQFQECKLLDNDEWLSLANACLSECKDEELDEGKATQLLDIVVLTWQHVDAKKRPEIELDKALADGNFFRNLSYGETDHLPQALLFFLCSQKLGEALVTPTKLQSNGTRPADSSDAFVEFKAILNGEGELTSSQADIVAAKAIDSFSASHWLSYGSANHDHVAVRQVVAQMFEREVPPYLTPSGLMGHFSYLRELLSTDTLSIALTKYSARAKTA